MSVNAEAYERVRIDIAAYYNARIQKYGPTPLGVDWTCVPTQELRFVQLLKVCDFARPFMLNDVGCGYGALLAFLGKRHPKALIDYMGTDLSVGMISRAHRMWVRRPLTAFRVAGADANRVADYSIASGIFNIKLHNSDTTWREFIKKALSDMHSTSLKGFAVNFLNRPASKGLGPSELYRTDPDHWVRYCEESFRAKVECLSDYGMREFTLVIRPI
jgi:SAM-dependent methyltransferase